MECAVTPNFHQGRYCHLTTIMCSYSEFSSTLSIHLFYSMAGHIINPPSNAKLIWNVFGIMDCCLAPQALYY